MARDAEQRPGRGRRRPQDNDADDAGPGDPGGEETKDPKDRRFGELRATLEYYRSGAPLLRYWWVVVIGGLAAVLVGLLALQAKKEPYQYTASAQLLVSSPEAPYFRYSITREGTRSVGQDQAPQVVIDTGPPDTTTLVQAANLYPLLIESDLVAKERISRFGQVPGEIDARAIFAVQTPNRFEGSSVPVIEVSATSTDPADAVKLADTTVSSFAGWIQSQQNAAEVNDDQRILIQPISAARVVSQTGGPTYAIPLLLGAAVFLAFCGLAFVLDSITLRGRRLLDEQAGAPRPIPLSNTTTSEGEPVRSREIEGSGSA